MNFSSICNGRTRNRSINLFKLKVHHLCQEQESTSQDSESVTNVRTRNQMEEAGPQDQSGVYHLSWQKESTPTDSTRWHKIPLLVYKVRVSMGTTYTNQYICYIFCYPSPLDPSAGTIKCPSMCLSKR